jgi:hypothetical protein
MVSNEKHACHDNTHSSLTLHTILVSSSPILAAMLKLISTDGM